MWIERNWNFEIHEWQFSQFFIILSEKIAICGVISCEMARIMGLGCEVNGISQLRTEVKHDAKKCFCSWMFRDYEFTNPSHSLISSIIAKAQICS